MCGPGSSGISKLLHRPGQLGVRQLLVLRCLRGSVLLYVCTRNNLPSCARARSAAHAVTGECCARCSNWSCAGGQRASRSGARAAVARSCAKPEAEIDSLPSAFQHVFWAAKPSVLLLPCAPKVACTPLPRPLLRHDRRRTQATPRKRT